MFLLPEGQTGEALDPSNVRAISKIVEHCIVMYFQFCSASSKSGIGYLTCKAHDMWLC